MLTLKIESDKVQKKGKLGSKETNFTMLLRITQIIIESSKIEKKSLKNKEKDRPIMFQNIIIINPILLICDKIFWRGGTKNLNLSRLNFEHLEYSHKKAALHMHSSLLLQAES